MKKIRMWKTPGRKVLDPVRAEPMADGKEYPLNLYWRAMILCGDVQKSDPKARAHVPKAKTKESK